MGQAPCNDTIHMKQSYLREAMKIPPAACSGTIFFYCCPEEEEQIAAIAHTEGLAGRRLFTRKDCQNWNPVMLADSPRQKAILVRPSMIEFLTRYLEACPAGQQHLLLCSRQYSDLPYMSRIFHDFWEERDITIGNFF